MKAQPSMRSLRSLLCLRWHRCAPAVLAAAVHLSAAHAQLPSDYSPQIPNPPAAVPDSNAAPLEQLPAPRQLQPSPVAPVPEAAPQRPIFAQPPMAALDPSNGPPAAPARTFRERWHYCMQSHLWGFPSQFPRPPLGYFQYQHGQTEVNNGLATLMTLYQYDFVDGSDKLNLHGRDQLAKIASLLPKTFWPILIERTPEAPALAEARRAAVLHELEHGPFPIPPQRVVVGPTLGDDLRGVEAQLVNTNLMIQTMTRGLSAHGGMMGAVGGGMGGMGISAMGGGMGGAGIGGVGGTGGISGVGGFGGFGGTGMGVGGMGMGLGR